MSKHKVGDKFIINIKEVLESEKGTLYRADYNTLTFDDYGLDGLQKHDALQERLELIDELKKAEYNKGLNDAWELAQKIWNGKDSENVEIFGTKFVYEICQLSPQEALAKLKAYEDSKIEVGDVIKAKDIVSNVEILVTRIYTEDATFDGFKISPKSEFGETYYEREIEPFEKTGKHIDITSILEQIGGE